MGNKVAGAVFVLLLLAGLVAAIWDKYFPPSPIDALTWDDKPPDRAYCLQRDYKVLAGQFLVRCFKTADLCETQLKQDRELGPVSPCLLAEGLTRSPLWKDAKPGGVLDSWHKYSGQAFPPPFPQLAASDNPSVSKGQYKVSMWFAGSFDREDDIAPLSQQLRAMGWDVQNNKNDRTITALGVREVRCFSADDQSAAEELAKDVIKAAEVMKTRIASPLDSKRCTDGKSGTDGKPGTLQIWFSN